MRHVNRVLSEVDPEVAKILDGEMDRQQNCLVMIPSENYASKAVLQTQGCIMTNLMLIDLTDKGITGGEAADLLEEAGIIVNKNLIPFDKKSPMECSGIRPGTPALTTRGMKEPEMEVIARMFSGVLSNPGGGRIRAQVRQEVRSLCRKFLIYEDLEVWQ